MTKKTKRIFLVACILLLTGLCVGMAFFAGALTQDQVQNQKLRDAGRIDFGGVNLLDSGDKTPAYTGEHIRIYAEDLDQYEQKAALAYEDPAEAKAEALKALAIREILVWKADEAGITMSPEELEDWITGYREEVESAENYDDFLSYLQGTGMSVEEYWTSVRTNPDFLKEVLGTRYVELLQQQFAEEQKMSTEDSGFYPLWSSYFQDFKDQAYRDEHLQKAETEPEESIPALDSSHSEGTGSLPSEP